MKRIFIAPLVLAIFIWSCTRKPDKAGAEKYEKIPNSILIVYTSGMPYKTLSDLTPEETDAYTGPTPFDMNIEIISQRLFAKLKDLNYNVKLVKASEVKSYKEILQYDMLVVGTPTYFWGMHWEIKKMMDLHFEKIYVHKRDEFKKMKHVVFSMAEYGDCAQSANRQMTLAIADCSAKVDTSAIFITKQSRQEYDKQIKDFATITETIMGRK